MHSLAKANSIFAHQSPTEASGPPRSGTIMMSSTSSHAPLAATDHSWMIESGRVGSMRRQRTSGTQTPGPIPCMLISPALTKM